MREVRIDNLVRLYTLLLLQGKPQHGYEIIKTLDEKLGRAVSPGQIYPFLKKLQHMGYLEAKKSGGREKKTYALTKSGRNFSNSMIKKFDAMMELAIKNRLKACAHCSCEVYKGGYKSGGKNFCCRNCAHAYSSKR